MVTNRTWGRASRAISAVAGLALVGGFFLTLPAQADVEVPQSGVNDEVQQSGEPDDLLAEGAQSGSNEDAESKEPSTSPLTNEEGLLGSGLLTEYYPQARFAGPQYSQGPNVDWTKAPAGTRIGSNIDFGALRPTFKLKTGQEDHIAVRWSGQIDIPTTGEYTFNVIGDNGYRLYIDDELVADYWVYDWNQDLPYEAGELTAGLHDFRFEFFSDMVGARAHVMWTGPGISKETVPAMAYRLPASVEFPTWAQIAASGQQIDLLIPEDTVVGSALTPEDFKVRSSDSEDYINGLRTVTGVEASGSGAIQLTLESAVTEGTLVDIEYVGQALERGGNKVPGFDVSAFNASEYFVQTPWVADLEAALGRGELPLPEYPRPQMERDNWVNLNGNWDFAKLVSSNDAVDADYSGADSAIVPFPIESKLSGVGQHLDHFQYSRDFTAEELGFRSGEKLLLNFGAVDYKTWVYVNGTLVAEHRGGYDPFSVDITEQITPGTNNITIKVTDTTYDTQVRGKQTQNAGGIFYTSVSGIWQTVWTESVPQTYLDDLIIVPDLDNSRFLVKGVSDSSGEVSVVVTDRNGVKATGTGSTNTDIAVAIPNPILWSPDDPHLYDIEVTLGDDSLSSYAGMRKIALCDGQNGELRICLNDEQTFILSTLDQGYWPDGVYTAPTDEALAWDIEVTKELGFNTIRKHIKVEPARWYYHADKIGMMVWQDMPGMGMWSGNGKDHPGGIPGQLVGDAEIEQFKTELSAMVDNLRSVTSIIGWIPMNEGWGEREKEDTASFAKLVKESDPTRLVNTHSGVNCCFSMGDSCTGDILDWHAYNGPAAPGLDYVVKDAEENGRAYIDGEHGGFAYFVGGHLWPGAFSPYPNPAKSPAELTDRYVANTAQQVRLAQEYMAGSVYTQITDVEQEVNGLYTYDRQFKKVETERFAAINKRVIEAGSGKAPETVAPPKATLAHYTFEEGEGSVAKDTSGAENNMELSGGYQWVEGRESGAVQFDGSGQGNAFLKDFDSTASYTVSAWVKMNELPSVNKYATVASIDGEDGRSSFFLQYGQPIGGFGMSFAEGPKAIAKSTPSSEEWHHLVGVRDAENKTLSIYVDGEEIETVKAISASSTTGKFALGRGQFDSNEVDFLKGVIDEVCLLNYAADDELVQTLFGEGCVETPTYAPDGTVEISGTPSVDESLSVVTEGWPEGTEFSYQWMVAEGSEGPFTEIAGGTGAGLLLTSELSGKYLKVVATAHHEDLDGPREVESEVFGPIEAVDPETKVPSRIEVNLQGRSAQVEIAIDDERAPAGTVRFDGESWSHEHQIEHLVRAAKHAPIVIEVPVHVSGNVRVEYVPDDEDVHGAVTTFAIESGLAVVTPEAPTLVPAEKCGQQATVAIPSSDVVKYSQIRDGDRVTVTAELLDDSAVFAAGATTEWEFDTSAEACENGSGNSQEGGAGLAATGADVLPVLVLVIALGLVGQQLLRSTRSSKK